MKRRKLFIPTVVSILSLMLYTPEIASYAAAPKAVQLAGGTPTAAIHGK